jgi:hypothetical protein
VNTHEVITAASAHLQSLSGHVFDLLTVAKPVSPNAAVNLAKVVSKLSPMLGNLIEFNTVEFLNDRPEFKQFGTWQRQDPGFPDAIFAGSVIPTPGFEIKAWFPLATEITARFKDSQNHFAYDNTYVCMLAWLPENLIFGRPRIIDVCVVSGQSVARARDNHYHNPPDYLVIEPRDTKARTRNLQQTNTNGYKFQGTPEAFKAAQDIVSGWRLNDLSYQPTAEYQALLANLMGRFDYRLDTNFAKMDRIAHEGIEAFKRRVMATQVHGMTIGQWSGLLASENETRIRHQLEHRFGIIDRDAADLVR